MRMLSRREADQLLAAVDLRIGSWNELARVGANAALRKAFQPPRDALKLYSAARRLWDWIAPEGWTFLQVGNSTAPTDDEIGVFENLVFPADVRWSVGEERSFLFGDVSNASSDVDRTSLALLVFFSLLFEWHVYLASENSGRGRHLALEDGVVYFYGDRLAIDDADALVGDLAKDPLHYRD